MKNLPKHIPFEELPFHLNIQADAWVFITSDLKQLAVQARSRGQMLNIDAFIDNFKKVLKDGTLVIPAYTDQLKNGDTFFYEKGKPTTGALSNRIFKRKDFKRSFDPLHSVFVWGKGTEEILSCKDKSTFGKDSVFHVLQQNNCTFLFFDVHINKSFTFVHYVEEQLKVPYRKYNKWIVNYSRASMIQPREVWFYTRKLGVASDVEALSETFFARNLMQTFWYNDCRIDRITAEDAAATIEEFIKEKKYLYHFSWKILFWGLKKRIENNLKSIRLSLSKKSE